jgi:hypothetical protein
MFMFSRLALSIYAAEHQPGRHVLQHLLRPTVRVYCVFIESRKGVDY